MVVLSKIIHFHVHILINHATGKTFHSLTTISLKKFLPASFYFSQSNSIPIPYVKAYHNTKNLSTSCFLIGSHEYNPSNLSLLIRRIV